MFTKLSVLFLTLWLMTDIARPGPGKGLVCSCYYNTDLKKYVYSRVEVEPEFAGGAAAYQRFLNKHLRIPVEVIDIQEPLTPPMMKFVVDTDSLIKNITINDKASVDDMNPIEKEALRIIKLMTKWNPGICQGKAVATEVKRPLFICILLETEN